MSTAAVPSPRPRFPPPPCGPSPSPSSSPPSPTVAPAPASPPSAVSSAESSRAYDARRDVVRASVRDAAAGAAAGAFAKTAVAPVERVKLLMQLGGSVGGRGGGGAGSGASVGGVGVGVGVVGGGAGRTSAWGVARTVYREQGIPAFWRGNTPNVVRQGGAAALNFTLMDRYKRAISPVLSLALPSRGGGKDDGKKRSRALISSFLSGGLAGGTTTTVLYPAEFMRTRLAMDVGSTRETRLYPRGMRDVLRVTWRTDGMRGLYQGYGIAVAGVVVYRALHLGGYDAVKAEMVHRRRHTPDVGKGGEPATLTMAERFAAAQMVSVVAGTMCYPIDSVRRRLMMQAGRPLEMRKYKNSAQCFRRVMAEEGIGGFFLGLGPNLVRSLGGALLLVGYDAFKGIIM